MDEEIERLLVSVRADTKGFERDVSEMRRLLDGPLGDGADKAGRAIESALIRAVRTGKLGFEELKAMALSVMAEIAASAIRSGLQAILGSGGNGGIGGILASAIPAVVTGYPGRATGGSVAPGRPYLVGERGPELFVPTASGQVAAGGGGGVREVRVAITVNGAGGRADAPRMLAQSSRQVARAVRAALAEER